MPWFVDKTNMIGLVIKTLGLPAQFGVEKIRKADVLMITAPRRFGKTTNIDMLLCFFAGILSKETFEKLNIGKNSQAMNWWGKFHGIFITFAHFLGVIQNKEEAVNACRSIIHATFVKYDYIRSDLPKECIESVDAWIDETEYKKKTKSDIAMGVELLIRCIRHYYGDEKPILLFVDEFDRICSRAMFNTKESDEIDRIITVYCDMIGNAAKYESQCLTILTGVSAITCRGLSSLNNVKYIRFLENKEFSQSYGITREEFEDVMARDEIPKIVREQKEEAYRWYNGYDYDNMKLQILNTYSVVNFIKEQKIASYWRASGAVEGLDKSLKNKLVREKILQLLCQKQAKEEKEEKKLLRISIKLMPYLKAKDFSFIQNDCYELIDCDIVLNFLLQQGYVSIKKKEDADKTALIIIPNYEVKLEFQARLMEYYQETFKFNQTLIKSIRGCFTSINISDENDCFKRLTEAKNAMNLLLKEKNTKKAHVNEAWIEAFLFHIFSEAFEVELQKPIPETVRNNNMRTATKLDPFYVMEDRCFVLEESMELSAEDALQKIFTKQYNLPAVNLGLPYLLIGLSVGEGINGIADISLCFCHGDFNKGKVV